MNSSHPLNWPNDLSKDQSAWPINRNAIYVVILFLFLMAPFAQTAICNSTIVGPDLMFAISESITNSSNDIFLLWDLIVTETSFFISAHKTGSSGNRDGQRAKISKNGFVAWMNEMGTYASTIALAPDESYLLTSLE